jgi:hypothetical protein
LLDPSEAQGPGFYTFKVCAYQPGNSLSPLASTSFDVTVQETNTQPNVPELPAGVECPIVVNERGKTQFTVTTDDPDNSGGPYRWFIHRQDFSELKLEPWTAYSRASNKNWEPRKFGDRYYAQINGFGADEASDDWLISPKPDFSGTTEQVLTLESAKINAGPDLKVRISTDYSGAGDPASATWTDLTATLSVGNEDVVPSGDIDLSAYAGKPSVYLAFQYTSDGTTVGTAAICQVGDIRVLGTFPALVQKLTFKLGGGAPSWASINPDTGEFTATPGEADGPGEYNISFFAMDDGAPNATPLTSDPLVCKIIVNEFNEPPVLQPIADVTMNEETVREVQAETTDPDLPANPLTYSLVGAPPWATINPTTGLIRLAPGEIEGPGVYAITAKVTDDSPQAVNEKNLGDIKSFQVTVNEVNRSPVVGELTDTVIDELTTLSLTATASDPDVPANTWSFSFGPGAPDGARIDPVTGAFTWKPGEAQGPGIYTITIIATDSGTPPLSGSEAFTVTVNEVNTPPVASGQTVTSDEDTPTEITLIGSDADLPANTLTYLVLSGPSHGTLEGTPPNLTYKPAQDYHGSDSFTFRVNDGQADSAEATVTITVNPINDPPVATGQGVTTDEDTPLAVTLTGSDVEADALTVTVVSGPSHGTLEATAPNLTYKPAKDYHGPDSFTFNANDGQADSAPATVDITVKPVNDPPVANARSVTTDEDTTLSIPLTGSDVDGDLLTFAVVNGPSHGTLEGTPPNLTYKPAQDYHGPDSFTFKANDGQADSAEGTVTITVSPVNDPPVANAQSVTTDEDTPLPITLTGSDVDGDALIFSVATAPSHGTLEGAPPNLTYNPAQDYHGPDSFTFKANDGQANSAPAAVNITVERKGNRPPVLAVPGDLVVCALVTQRFVCTATDPDGNALVFALIDPPTGAAIDAVTGLITWTPANGQRPATILFKVRVTDNGEPALSDEKSFTVFVPDNCAGAPVIAQQPQGQAVEVGSRVTLTVLAVGTEPLTYQWRRNGVNLSGATEASLVIDAVKIEDAGSYSVAVANAFGAVNSDEAVLVVLVPEKPPGDNFAERVRLEGDNGEVRGTNADATREVGEPLHAGKRGEHSVWYSWVPTANGIATFTTVGSAFDTLLGIYTGSAVGGLTPVVSDEDRSGSLTSAVQFNAVAGTEYQIAIDGFFTGAGNFTLSWGLERTPDRLPEITRQPQSQTVARDAAVTFTVDATGDSLNYQWFFNGAAIAGATASSHSINPVKEENVGRYWVTVGNAVRLIVSQPADLQIHVPDGPTAGQAAAAMDKLADLLRPAEGQAGRPLRSQSRAGGLHAVGGPPLLSHGVAFTQIFNTRGALKEPGEPNHRGEIGGASAWFDFRAERDGLVTVSSVGDGFDTVAAVYTWSERDYDELQPVLSEEGESVAGRNRVTFHARQGTTYYVAVDGVRGAAGKVKLHVAMAVLNDQLEMLKIGERQVFKFRLEGQSGQRVKIQGSADFKTWVDLSELILLNGSAEYVDLTSPGDYRFYRAIPASWPSQ